MSPDLNEVENNENFVKNYYQGIFVTETILGNPNGDFVDNSPRNFDSEVFTTDKCIKYNIRNYLHDTVEDLENKKNIVFFYPRRDENTALEENKFLTVNTIKNQLFNDTSLEKLRENYIDVRMFGGTFAIGPTNNKNIYGPIQLTYGIDINQAQIKPLNIVAPFATSDNQQKTYGSEYVVDDAIISYDITVNPKTYTDENNNPYLLLEDDLNLFKSAIWYGTNYRKSTSKRTNSKLLILIKFKVNEDDTILNMGELNNLISIEGKRKTPKDKCFTLDMDLFCKKLCKYEQFIELIDIYYEKEELELNFNDDFKTKFNGRIHEHDPISLVTKEDNSEELNDDVEE